MIILWLFLLGLCFGSFVNALVWRVHEQASEVSKKHPNKQRLQRLSIMRGRSLCPKCSHELAAKDLLPVVSWLSTQGRCRYCRKPISRQYPLVELLTAVLFVLSYLWWPQAVNGVEWLSFGLWLALLTGFVALIIYDLRWMLLPDRIVFPLFVIAGAYALLAAASATDPGRAIFETVLSVALGGGIFYVLFQASSGKWIGGGDVKLGWLLGLIVATPANSLLFIFLAALLGSLVSVPLLAFKRLKPKAVIPFGPFLIVGAFIVQFFGADIITWYQSFFIPY